MCGSLCEPRHGGDAHVDDAARRDVVDEDRQLGCVMQGLEVLVEPFLGRLVVIGRDDERAVGARLLGVAREVDRLRGRVGAGAGDDRDPPLRHLDAELDDALVLGMAQGRRFAGRAARHDGVRPFLDLPVDEALKALLVDGAIPERRDERDQRALEHGVLRRKGRSTNLNGGQERLQPVPTLARLALGVFVSLGKVLVSW